MNNKKKKKLLTEISQKNVINRNKWQCCYEIKNKQPKMKHFEMQMTKMKKIPNQYTLVNFITHKTNIFVFIFMCIYFFLKWRCV